MKIAFHNPDRELTFQLYRAPGESNRPAPDDLQDPLQELGASLQLRAKNPVTHEVWSILVQLAKDNPAAATLGPSTLALLRLWLKERKGRRIEIQRPGLTIKAGSVREMKAALDALHEYDELNLMINNARPPVPKKAATKKESCEMTDLILSPAHDLLMAPLFARPPSAASSNSSPPK